MRPPRRTVYYLESSSRFEGDSLHFDSIVFHTPYSIYRLSVTELVEFILSMKTDSFIYLSNSIILSNIIDMLLKSIISIQLFRCLNYLPSYNSYASSYVRIFILHSKVSINLLGIREAFGTELSFFKRNVLTQELPLDTINYIHSIYSSVFGRDPSVSDSKISYIRDLFLENYTVDTVDLNIYRGRSSFCIPNNAEPFILDSEDNKVFTNFFNSELSISRLRNALSIRVPSMSYTIISHGLDSIKDQCFILQNCRLDVTDTPFMHLFHSVSDVSIEDGIVTLDLNNIDYYMFVSLGIRCIGYDNIYLYNEYKDITFPDVTGMNSHEKYLINNVILNTLNALSSIYESKILLYENNLIQGKVVSSDIFVSRSIKMVYSYFNSSIRLQLSGTIKY